MLQLQPMLPELLGPYPCTAPPKKKESFYEVVPEVVPDCPELLRTCTAVMHGI